MHAPADRTKRQEALEAILSKETAASFREIDDETAHAREADKALLSHVLQQAGVRLADYTSRSLDEELDFWDRNYLADLAQNIGQYTGIPEAKNKLSYLIAHSIADNLVETLSSKDEHDTYAAYNQHVLRAMERSGQDVNSWLFRSSHRFYAQSMNPAKPFALEFVQWKRDFRQDFSIGNVSDCCIAVNNEPRDQNFKTILLDYFLDLSIQVVHINKLTAGRALPLGQIYFVALDNEGKVTKTGLQPEGSGPTLGVTSVELACEHRSDLDLVPPITESILGDGGYEERFNYQTVLIGQRFSAFRNYLARRQEDISNRVTRLKQRRQNLVQERRTNRAPQDISRSIETLDDERQHLERIRNNIYPLGKFSVVKAGLTDAVEAGEPYRGTNYLDIYNNHENGFFHTDGRPHITESHVIYGDGLLGALERTLSSLRTKYTRRRSR